MKTKFALALFIPVFLVSYGTVLPQAKQYAKDSQDEKIRSL